MPRSTNNKPYRTPKGTSSAYFEQGSKLAEKALLYGFFGLFFMGIVLGPMALHYAREASAYGNNKVYGAKLLGVWATVIGVIGMLIIFALIFSSMQPELIEPGLADSCSNAGEYCSQ